MNISLHRRLFAVVLAAATFAVVLLAGTGAATAAPAPYPPGNPTSSSRVPAPSCTPSAGASSGSNDACGHGTRARNERQTASTGFAAATASLVAAALLAGGFALVVAGRRRRHS